MSTTDTHAATVRPVVTVRDLLARVESTYLERTGLQMPEGLHRAFVAQLRSLWRQGQPMDVVALALDLVLQDDPAKWIPQSVSFKLATAKRLRDEGLDEWAARAREYVAANQSRGRWPTGIRRVRGSHGHAFVRDPLGYDRVDAGDDPLTPADVSLVSIARALRSRVYVQEA